MRFPTRLALAAALALSFALPAQAEKLVIEGRAAQALHCATMLLIVGGVLYEVGEISERDYRDSTLGVILILDHVPGTEAQKMQAMKQRGKKILETRTPEQLSKEFSSTADWCMAKFL